MFVRWLGLYGEIRENSLEFEMTRTSEACAEYIPKNRYTSVGGDGDVGFICNKAGVVRIFHEDADSYLENGRLRRSEFENHAGRKIRNGNGHGWAKGGNFSSEAWVKPGSYEAVVFVNDRAGFAGLPKNKKAILLRAHQEYGLPVYQMLVHRLKRIM